MYLTLPETPVMFNDCKTKEEQILHRIRRGLEKARDYGREDEADDFIYGRVMPVVCDLIAEAVMADRKTRHTEDRR